MQFVVNLVSLVLAASISARLLLAVARNGFRHRRTRIVTFVMALAFGELALDSIVAVTHAPGISAHPLALPAWHALYRLAVLVAAYAAMLRFPKQEG